MTFDFINILVYRIGSIIYTFIGIISIILIYSFRGRGSVILIYSFIGIVSIILIYLFRDIEVHYNNILYLGGEKCIISIDLFWEDGSDF